MDIQSQDIGEVFELLESNDSEVVNDIKQVIHEHLKATKDSWLIFGLYDHCVATSSLRCIEIFAAIREPHDKYLMDRLLDGLRGTNRHQTLLILAHLVGRQPSWVHKIGNHGIFKDMFKLLKTENDVVLVMSAILIFVQLLPILPSLFGSCLNDIFEVFSRIAVWNTVNPNRIPEEHRIHIQVALYALFHRLYGLYPCNFLSYLRTHYGQKENITIFIHTVKPMLHTVKMHPLLVTATKDAEVAVSRWKRMEYHDVLVASTQFSLDVVESSLEDVQTCTQVVQSIFQTRRSSESVDSVSTSLMQLIKQHKIPRLSLLELEVADIWSPSFNYGIGDDMVKEQYSPPEPAVEATPETTPLSTPVKGPDMSGLTSAFSYALSSGPVTPVQSAPSSPMPSNGERRGSEKFAWERRDSLFGQRLQRVVVERQTEGVGNKNFNGRGARRSIQLSPLKMPNSTAQPQDDTDEATSQIDEQMSSGAEPMGDLMREEHQDDQNSKEKEGSTETSESETIEEPPIVPDEKLMINFAQQVHRIRTISQCTAEKNEKEEEDNFRKSNSLPHLVHADGHQEEEIVDSKDIQEAKSEDTCGTEDISTQTDTCGFLYESLFQVLYPNHDIKKKQVSQESGDGPTDDQQFQMPHTIFNRYYDVLSQVANSSPSKGQSQLDNELSNIRKQLQLLHCQLLFERHRREVHAERNRRLAGKAKNARSTEEQNAALKDQLLLLEQEVKELKGELVTTRYNWQQDVKKWQAAEAAHEEQLSIINSEKQKLSSAANEMKNWVADRDKDVETIQKQVQQHQTKEFQLQKDISKLQEDAKQSQSLMLEVEHLRKELAFMGELQRMYQEQTAYLKQYHCADAATEMMLQTSHKEAEHFRHQYEKSLSQCNAIQNRVADLEATIAQKEQVIIDQKRLLKKAKEEAQERIMAIEQKYEALKAVNILLERQAMDLQCKADEKMSRTSAAVAVARPPGHFSGHSFTTDSSTSPPPSAGNAAYSPDQFMFGRPELTDSVDEPSPNA